MNVEEFFTKYNGRFVDYDGKFGNQCVDLMRQYIKEVLGLDPYKTIPATNYAKNMFYNFPDGGTKQLVKIYNGPTNVPKEGDILFWKTYPFITGIAGHVAIFSEGNLYTVVTFGQNYPTGQPCKFYKYGKSNLLHGYRGVIGWLHPRS